MLTFILNVWLVIAAFAKATSLDSCLAGTGATLVYSNSSFYTNLSTPDVIDFHYHPSVLVIPSSTQQVASAVKCVSADKGKTTLTVVSGGHNLVGYSFSGDVVILSNKMTGIAIDSAKKQVSVQFGQKLGSVAKAIGQKGYGLPHGIAPIC